MNWFKGFAQTAIGAALVSGTAYAQYIKIPPSPSQVMLQLELQEIDQGVKQGDRL